MPIVLFILITALWAALLLPSFFPDLQAVPRPAAGGRRPCTPEIDTRSDRDCDSRLSL
jgi:hypothetical protein